MNKKLFLLISIFGVAFSEVDNLESGKNRLIAIMSNNETGVAAYNKKNITYVETQNLAQDLHIDEIAQFFDCKTIIGRAYMAETLKLPVSKTDKNEILARRQAIIKLLVENPELKKEINDLLEFAQQEEQSVVELLSDYFKGKTCPELKQLEVLRQQQNPFVPVAEFFHLNPTGKIISTTINLISLPMMIWSTKKIGQVAYLQAKNHENCTKMALYSAYCGVMSAFTAREMYKDYAFSAEKRKKIHALNRLITIAEKIETISTAHNLQTQFKMSNIKFATARCLIDKLKHPRYADKNTKLFAVPLVHSFLYELFREEKHLAEVFSCIAEIDTYNAIATKIIASANVKNKFCFVSFIDDEKPMVRTTGNWNVLVTHAVTSDLSEKRHIILTGPNAGGKTTAIRALLQNIVLGQTFGIAAATSFEFTMFDIIHSYLNISDDLKNGLSLFASEVKRAQEILQKITSLEPTKKFFFALDELFTGTVAEDGEVCAYRFVKKISEYKGTQFIYATHFKKLKELGTDNDICINYKVDAPVKNDAGKLVYPYTLSQGANETNVAIDLAKEAQLFA